MKMPKHGIQNEFSVKTVHIVTNKFYEWENNRPLMLNKMKWVSLDRCDFFEKVPFFFIYCSVQFGSPVYNLGFI